MHRMNLFGVPSGAVHTGLYPKAASVSPQVLGASRFGVPLHNFQNILLGAMQPTSYDTLWSDSCLAC